MKPPRFLFHASAVGLSGEILRPIQHKQIIEAQAPTALPRYGGGASARLERFDVPGIVAHKGAATQANGAYQGHTDTFETTVQSTLTGFDLRGILTADVLTASVTSSHPSTAGGEPKISIKGSQIQGLRIAGKEIELEPRLDIFNQLDSLSKLRDYYKDNASFREDFERAAYVGQEGALPEDVRNFFPWRRHKKSSTLHEYNGMTIIPLYTVKNPSEPGFEVYGNVIRVHDFGRVHIGELIIESHRRRVMMLHADLGSPVEGTFTASCSDGNGGSGNPPPPNGGGN